jgi:DNA-binding transcriptional regulator YiaG
MAISMNNHVFKGHKTLLGNKFVTYGELELPTRYDVFPKSSAGFDWGNGGTSSIQLGFSMLYQLTNKELAQEYAILFTNEVIKNLNSRDWMLSANDVLKWIEKNCEEKLQQASKQENIQTTSTPVKNLQAKTRRKSKKNRSNVVKDICKELSITQKQLAEILEVPEGTVSSWAVKDEIPRLGKKAIEFYKLNVKNQKIVESYRSFQALLQEQ